MNQQPKALELADRLASRQVRNYWSASGDTPKSNGFRPDRECSEAADLLRTQHAELEALRALLRTQRTVINDQQTELDRKSDAIQRLWAERDALRTEVERLREDAARLDWLSDIALSMDAVSDPDSLTQVHFGTDPCRTAYGRTLRAAIDAAREAKG